MTSRLKLLFSESVKSEIRDHDCYADLMEALPPNYFDWDGFCQAQYLESTALLPGYILSSQGDRMAMAHSVEARFPFLDHRIVEFASTIPPRLKMKALEEKRILKRAATGLIPASVIDRSKQPYRAPEAGSFFGPEQAPAWQPYIRELLSQDRIRQDGIFNPMAVQNLMRKVETNQSMGIRDNMALVGVLSTQLLVDQFINNFGKECRNGRD